jgi:Putative peptidoglycan binding domain
MPVNYRTLCRELEQELLSESFEREFESEAGLAAAAVSIAGPLRSLRFGDDPDLQAVALGRLRLGRANDSPYPAPIRSQGEAIRKVQQALLDLGYSLPRTGDDGRYGEETYRAVLAYKQQFNIRTASGYLDGIVGVKTIQHLDGQFSPGPLPACPAPGGPIIAAEGEFEDSTQSIGVPWVTCDPLLDLPGGFCQKSLPDKRTQDAAGGFGVIFPSIGSFYCINKPRIRLEFRADWIEMLPRDQRPEEDRNREPSAPQYQVNFKGFISEWLKPGQGIVRNLTVAAPGMGRVQFITSSQRNRIFRVELAISESD